VTSFPHSPAFTRDPATHKASPGRELRPGKPDPLYVGTAGWAIRREHDSLYDGGEHHLTRYATRFPAVEINSSFYRPHRPATCARWATCVPEHFRFAVKMPKTITHQLCLVGCDEQLKRFLSEVTELKDRLGPLLVQLPPKLAFDSAIAQRFFSSLRQRFAGDVVCEPRHETWFAPRANDMLFDLKIGRVAADPACVPQAAQPGGSRNVVYYRLHGSPRTYYSEYDDGFLGRIAEALAVSLGRSRWCIFDNTARGAATVNALKLRELTGGYSFG
jgi:uncharacterized protein YecE (DUF72 family)